MLSKRLVILLSIILCSTPLWAQMTTSGINGKVKDFDEKAIEFVIVTATHIPSGTDYHTMTNDKGHYSIDGMRPGGPYKVAFSCIGYKSEEYTNLYLELAEVASLNVRLPDDIETLEAAIVVSAKVISNSQSERTGSVSNITSQQFNSLPKEDLNITSITRISPFGGNGMNIAGGNGRTVNFTVDGANFNNNLGLGDKIPGGGNPISIEALAEVQVVVSPYDVRQNNFSTAGINTITKSGTNTFKGSAYYTINHKRVTTYGITLGGPIIQNKLFFFANIESNSSPVVVNKWRASEDGISSEANNVSRTRIVDLEVVSNFVKEKYGYNPGSYTDYPSLGGNIKLLSRIDWNINKTNKLSLRYNYTYNRIWNVANDNSIDGAPVRSEARSSAASMIYSNSMYAKDSYVGTWSLNLNSRITNSFHNEFLATFSRMEDKRISNSEPFPFIDILNAEDNDTPQNYISLGYELFSWNNHHYNNVLTVKDDLTYYIANHKITAGLSLESQGLYDSYMRNGTGYYQYYSIGDFLVGLAPLAVCLTYGFDGEPNPGAYLAFNNYSAYLQDDFSLGERLKINLGLRYEILDYFDDNLKTNGALYNIDYSGNGFHLGDGRSYTAEQEALAKRIDTGHWPKTSHTLSPRLGFSWDILGDKSLKLRGGTGVFTGRIPLVLLLNMPSNSGTIQNQTILNNTGLYNAQIADMSLFEGGLIVDSNGKATIEALKEFIIAHGYGPRSYEDNKLPSLISSVSPDFKMPQTWKTTLALDINFPTSFPLSLTVEGIYNKTINDVLIRDWSLKDYSEMPTFRGADERPLYNTLQQYHYLDGSLVPRAFVLENTNKGYGYLLSLVLNSKPIKGLELTLSYTHNKVYFVSDIPDDKINSVIPYIPNYRGFNHIDLHPSPNVIPNRVLATISYKLIDENNISLIYEGIQGSKKYSYMIANDLNADGYQYDLLYIPNNMEDIHFTTYNDGLRFWEFVNNDEYLSKHKGEYATAYAVNSPWFNKFDIRYTHNFPIKIGSNSNIIQFSLDIHNFMNLFNPSWGVSKEMNPLLHDGRILKFEGLDSEAHPIYSTPSTINDKVPTWTKRGIDKNNWGLQVGLKYLFN